MVSLFRMASHCPPGLGIVVGDPKLGVGIIVGEAVGVKLLI